MENTIFAHEKKGTVARFFVQSTLHKFGRDFYGYSRCLRYKMDTNDVISW